ncbi:growth inhibitor [Cyanobium sp. Copco_Reservoir_LC18]|uniref:type II toxin-antitoxin system PemK/MazF family toxin n=1 Tax=Cyanobium sp. Copco_Reservoir_LC18 TaxID=1328305 RepID=UPI00135A60EE|nr:type II toxin-antitoxin system PemK/MazF family toxin [Cyanobium sp. Copco_Reservoir_LC18]KAF0652268.1 growth inhibitor [Cyanobium sp. Copco_Reservoir_LC18]
MSPRRAVQGWVPDRGDVIWIDHNPFAVLSTASFHTTLGLVVGCAITSAPYNRGSTLAVDLGPIPDRPDAHRYVLCDELKSFHWRARGARPHPIGRLNDSQLEEVMTIVGQILGLVV